MLIVEDGTGVSNANAYATLDFVNQYFVLRGLDQAVLAQKGQSADTYDRRIWLGDPAQKIGAIIRATDHIEAVFGYRFLSKPLTETQALSFPREQWPEVPLRVQKACAEYALHAVNDDLIPHRETVISEKTSGKVIRRKEKIGPIEEETEYTPEGAVVTTEVATPKSYPTADLYLSPFIVLDVVQPGTMDRTIVWGSYTR